MTPDIDDVAVIVSSPPSSDEPAMGRTITAEMSVADLETRLTIERTIADQRRRREA